MNTEKINEIIDYWFGALDADEFVAPEVAKRWWVKNLARDKEVERRFMPDVRQAILGEYVDWLEDARGCLVSILLIDQFCRQLFRNTPRAFAYDGLALPWSLKAIAADLDQQLPLIQRVFVYMPLEHSEDKQIQVLSIAKFTELLDQAPESHVEAFKSYLHYAKQHKAIIDRFGRYPHRNAILGRPPLPEELEFLEQPGSSF